MHATLYSVSLYILFVVNVMKERLTFHQVEVTMLHLVMRLSLNGDRLLREGMPISHGRRIRKIKSFSTQVYQTERDEESTRLGRIAS